MTSYNPRLLTPPEEEELYPYRRVWRSLAIEAGALFGAAAMLFVAINLLDIRLPQTLNRLLAVLVALLPLFLWLVFSWFQERFAPQPRSRLAAVGIIAALAANAIGVPLVENYLQVDRWLPLSSAVTRILGYTFTIGIVQEMIKYLTVRYITWPDCFRIRLDGIAYGLAAAAGYATVLNLHYVAENAAALDVVAFRVFNTTAVLYAASILVGFGLSEVRFSRPSPVLLALTIALGATITGIAIPVRSGLVNASLSLTTSNTAPLQGLGFSLVVLVVVSAVVLFLIENAERQEREAAGREE